MGIKFTAFIMSLFGVFNKDALDLVSVLSTRWASRNDVLVSLLVVGLFKGCLSAFAELLEQNWLLGMWFKLTGVVC